MISRQILAQTTKQCQLYSLILDNSNYQVDSINPHCFHPIITNIRRCLALFNHSFGLVTASLDIETLFDTLFSVDSLDISSLGNPLFQSFDIEKHVFWLIFAPLLPLHPRSLRPGLDYILCLIVGRAVNVLASSSTKSGRDMRSACGATSLTILLGCSRSSAHD
jgi:hypothetical protein